MKIGFLAMSGIRAHDPELLKLGLTLPGFVERSKTIASLPSLGLLYLAACTPPGTSFATSKPRPTARSRPSVYDVRSRRDQHVLGAGVRSVRDRRSAAAARRARSRWAGCTSPSGPRKRRGTPTTSSSAKARTSGRRSCVPRSATSRTAHLRCRDFPPVDVARAARAALRPARRSPVQPLHGADLARLPVAVRFLRVERDARPALSQAAGRRTSSATSARSSSFAPEPFIEFADDNTFVDKAWGKELCRQLAPLHVKWFTETDISVADDAELLDLMRDAGCRQVLIGLESPAQGAAGGHRAARELQGAAGAADYADARAPHPVARHHGQRLLHPRPRRPHARHLRAGARLRLRGAAVRRADHGADAVPRHAAVRPAADGGPHPRSRGAGTCARCST